MPQTNIWSIHRQRIVLNLPSAQRRYGYFCLPLLYRDRLVGRIDCKAHRAQRRLEVRAIHEELPVARDFPELLAGALQSFAAFNACEQVDISARDCNHISELLPTRVTA